MNKILLFTALLMSFRIVAQDKILIDDDSSKIIIRRSNTDDEMSTRTFLLKHIEAIEIRDIVSSAVGRRGNVQSVQYEDGRSALIVTGPAYRLSNGGDIENVVLTLDKPSKVVVDDDTRFVYPMRYRSPRPVAKMINMLMEGRARATVDGEGNTLFVTGAPSAIREVKELLGDVDVRQVERSVEYEVFKVDVQEYTEIGVAFESWRATNEGAVASIIIGDGEEWFQRAFLYYLAENSKSMSVAKGVQQLSGGSLVSFNSSGDSGMKMHLTPRSFEESVELDLRLLSGRNTAFSTSVTLSEMNKDYVLGSSEIRSVVEQETSLPFLSWLIPGHSRKGEQSYRFVMLLRVVEGGQGPTTKKMLEDIKEEFKDF